MIINIKQYFLHHNFKYYLFLSIFQFTMRIHIKLVTSIDVKGFVYGSVKRSDPEGVRIIYFLSLCRFDNIMFFHLDHCDIKV